MSSKLDYQNYLDQVSRSFSFCIAQLKTPLKHQIGLSYLLFRILDTIEDAPWSTSSDKIFFFNLFEKNLLNVVSDEENLAWSQKFSSEIPQHEKNLLQVAPLLFFDFHQLGTSEKVSLHQALLTMQKGMLYFSEVHTQNKVLKIHSIQELNQYCFFVAGIIGELLTDLVAYSSQTLFNKPVYLNSYKFGLFLQKINILKDQLDDEKEGRYLVPDRQLVLKSLKADARGALNYLLNIPLKHREYRLFCAWSLFLGLSSLSFIEKSWLLKVFSKIPRLVTEQLLKQVESIIDDNMQIQKLFDQLSESLKETEPTLPQDSEAPNNYHAQSQWLLQAYKGQLNSFELQSLGVL